MLSTMLKRALQRWLSVPLDGSATQDLWGRQDALSITVTALAERIAECERGEALRMAEHAAALDSMTRLYKRVSARMAREHIGQGDEPANGESPLALRRRLRGS